MKSFREFINEGAKISPKTILQDAYKKVYGNDVQLEYISNHHTVEQMYKDLKKENIDSYGTYNLSSDFCQKYCSSLDSAVIDHLITMVTDTMASKDDELIKFKTLINNFLKINGSYKQLLDIKSIKMVKPNEFTISLKPFNKLKCSLYFKKLPDRYLVTVDVDSFPKKLIVASGDGGLESYIDMLSQYNTIAKELNKLKI